MKNAKNLKTCNIYGESLNWINGELLGDGCISTQVTQTAVFQYASKYLEYIKYVSDTLWRFGIIRAGKIHERKKSNSLYYQYTSCSYCELKILRDLWYPDGIKDVPRNIELTPLTCRQWYIGDGCLVNNGRQLFITLATNSFPISTVEWLVIQFTGMGIRTTRQPSSNQMYISAYSVRDFLDYIGECPVECYKYKWEVS